MVWFYFFIPFTVIIPELFAVIAYSSAFSYVNNHEIFFENKKSFKFNCTSF